MKWTKLSLAQPQLIARSVLEIQSPCRTLIFLTHSRTLVRLDALLTRARKATERRNELLHALWAHELDGDPVMRSEGTAFRPIPAVRELEDVAGEMARITAEIMEARLNGFLRTALDGAPLPAA